MKYFLIVAISLAGCDLSDKPANDRTPTLAYVTEAILAPTCGTAECHSSFHAQSGDVYDTVKGAQATLANPNYGLVYTCDKLATPLESPCIEAPANSYLITVITTTTVSGKRMPLDQVMSSSDIATLADWISNGATGLDLSGVPPLKASGN